MKSASHLNCLVNPSAFEVHDHQYVYVGVLARVAARVASEKNNLLRIVRLGDPVAELLDLLELDLHSRSPHILPNRQHSLDYTASQWAELIRNITTETQGHRDRFGAGNPARRVFQALRIEVNDELNSLRRALPAAFALLAPDGILAVISFHSLEDRIVKEFFAAQVRSCTCPPDFPVCVCGGQTKGEVLTHKAVTPGIRELEANPRSSSAKLRALRKL